MKLTGHTCPNCNASLIIPPDADKVRCRYCDSEYEVDNGKKAIDAAEKAGYNFEKGRQQARADIILEEKANNKEENETEKEHTSLIVYIALFGMCCCMYPLPVTIYCLQTDMLKKSTRRFLIIFSWVTYIAFAILGGIIRYKGIEGVISGK
ncbi:MAG: hypothetical protein K6G26_09725 [Lachnospiraceae bacterium]|nr:hypothetical protein [Lachnospiraceae bacterium]